MVKTIAQLASETGYDFDEGAPRTQYSMNKRWRLVRGTLFVSDSLLSDWEIYAKVADLLPKESTSLSA